MDLPRLFAAADLNWEPGERELPGFGIVPLYRGVDWFSEALRKLRRGAAADWTSVMARSCCRILADLEPSTTPEEMAEHLPEALNDEWMHHREYAAWIAGDPARAFEQVDRILDECPELGSAQAAELAMQREALELGVILIGAGEREWRARSCQGCGAYPFVASETCPDCRTPLVRPWTNQG